MTEPLKPTASLLCKLGSIAVHADEMLGPTGHEYDRTVLGQLLCDLEVKDWIEAMNKLAMVPRKRTEKDVALAAKRKEGAP